MTLFIYMKRNKHPNKLNNIFVLSNGSTFHSKSMFVYKRYLEQSTDLFNNNKWNSLLQNSLEDTFRGQQLKFKKRYRLVLSN